MDSQSAKKERTKNTENVSVQEKGNDSLQIELEFPVAIHEYGNASVGTRSIRWHWHDEIELLYVDEGVVELFVDNESFIVDKGQAAFINQNVLHSIRIDPEKANPHFFTLIFHPSFLFGFGRTLMAANFATPLLENQHMKSKLLTKESSNDFMLLNCIHEIIFIMIEKRQGYELLCQSLLCKIWYYLLIASNAALPKHSKSKRIANDEERIKGALLFIEEHFSENITLEDIADSIHISKSECCRCFKRILRISPFDYLLKFRIFSAAKMIQRNNGQPISIGGLAIAVGFSNISYFNKVFKKYLNMTPSEYREKHKNYSADDPLIKLPSLRMPE